MAAKLTPATLDCNPLCAKCRRPCRQPKTATLIDCPRFLPYPFKVEKNLFEQIDLFGESD